MNLQYKIDDAYPRYYDYEVNVQKNSEKLMPVTHRSTALLQWGQALNFTVLSNPAKGRDQVLLKTG